MLKVAALVWIILGVTLAGIGVAAVVTVPSLAAQAGKYILWSAVIGYALAAPLSFFIAKSMSKSMAAKRG